MKEKLKTLYEERLKIDKDQRDLLDKAEKESRALTDDEKQQYEDMDKRFNELTDEIKSIEEEERQKIERRQKLDQRKNINIPNDDSLRPDSNDLENGNEPVQEKRGIHDDRLNIYVPWDPRLPVLRGDRLPDTYEKRWAEAAGMLDTGGGLAEKGSELWKTFLIRGTRLLTAEQIRALQADDDVAGGFLVAPEQFMAELIQDKDRMVFMRRFSRVIPVMRAESLGVPELDTDPSDPDWTSEIATGGEDSSMNFEKRALVPHPLAKRIKVSNRLLRVAAIGIDALVRERLAYKFSVTEENAFLNGNGVNRPLGIFVSSANGISSTQDISAGNTATAIKADGLINAKYHLEAQYRMNCRWIFHRDAVKQIRKLKDGEGNYIWKAGISSDRPDTILEFPVHESEYAPNTFSASQYVGIVGDFMYYWIADALSYRVQVLTELYAETNQTGYIGRQEVDGAPVHEKAFTRVKLGS